MKNQIFASLFMLVLFISGVANASSTIEDQLLASCLTQIASNQNYCTVNLDTNDTDQFALAESLQLEMEKGNTYFVVLLDADGQEYDSWDSYYKATGGKSYCHIYFQQSNQFFIVTGMGEDSLTKIRRNSDFYVAIKQLVKSL